MFPSLYPKFLKQKIPISQREMRDDAAEAYPSSSPLKFRLPLIQTMLQSPQPSGLQTPPLQASVSVPFRWEDEPGKPRFSCTTVFPRKNLELPPRLLVVNAKSTKLEGSLLGREQCLLGKEFYGYGRRFSPQRGQLGDMVLRKRELKQRWLLGLSGRRALKSKREGFGDRDGAAMAESSVIKIKRNGKFSTLSHLNSHIWGAIYHGLKEMVPWGKRK